MKKTAQATEESIKLIKANVANKEVQTRIAQFQDDMNRAIKSSTWFEDGKSHNWEETVIEKYYGNFKKDMAALSYDEKKMLFDKDILDKPIKDRAPAVYTERKEGVRADTNIRTDRFELAVEATDKITKHKIARREGIDPKRIDVIPLASGINPETEPTEWNELKKRYDVGGEYCLYVGDVNWNKNIPGLLEGFAGFLNGQAGKALKPLLVLVGKAFLDLDLPETRDINRLIDQLHLGSSVRRTGFVPDEDLAGLYRYARVCIQPSWYEGFGFPVIESFTFGSPVIEE